MSDRRPVNIRPAVNVTKIQILTCYTSFLLKK